MEINRRTFLKVAGLIAAGFTIRPALDVYSKTGLPDLVPGQLAGRKWAMAVDLKKCSSREECRDCTEACRHTHNVPDMGSLKEEIKWIWKAPFGMLFPEQEHEYGDGINTGKSVLLMCNHCDEPACVKYCPTGATWKREDGIVMMDYHRCIGCRYCMAGCPYGSRSFNWRDPRPFLTKINKEFPTRTKGVVEKCNFCEERLAKGLLPACVTACKEKALIFGNLKDAGSEIRKALQGRYILQRQPELGTKPKVYYLL